MDQETHYPAGSAPTVEEMLGELQAWADMECDELAEKDSRLYCQLRYRPHNKRGWEASVSSSRAGSKYGYGSGVSALDALTGCVEQIRAGRRRGDRIERPAAPLVALGELRTLIHELRNGRIKVEFQGVPDLRARRALKEAGFRWVAPQMGWLAEGSATIPDMVLDYRRAYLAAHPSEVDGETGEILDEPEGEADK